MKRDERIARNAAIVARYRAGDSEVSLANVHSLSSGTVRCLLRQHGAIAPKPCPICGAPIKRHQSTTCHLCSHFTSLIQRRAVAAVAAAIRHGKLPKAKSYACSDCHKPAHDYDHREYSKPLVVAPVCRGCNQRRGPAVDLYDLARKSMGGEPRLPRDMVVQQSP